MQIPKQAIDVAWNRVNEQIVILALNFADRQFHELNATASAIWTSIDGIRSEQDIAEKIASQFEVDLDQATADTREFLVELSKKNLVHFSE